MANGARHMAYRFGSFALDLERGALLTIEGQELPLRPKSFALLRLLVENAGRLLAKEEIMDELWPGVFVTENSVTQCIHDIRSVLGAEARQTLRTRPRRGYLFTSDINVTLAPGTMQQQQADCGDEDRCPMESKLSAKRQYSRTAVRHPRMPVQSHGDFQSQ